MRECVLHILNQQRIVDTAAGNMYNNEIVKVALNADKISICGLNRNDLSVSKENYNGSKENITHLYRT